MLGHGTTSWWHIFRTSTGDTVAEGATRVDQAVAALSQTVLNKYIMALHAAALILLACLVAIPEHLIATTL